MPEVRIESIAAGEGEADVALEIEQRTIRARRVATGVAWFEFDELCDGPRAQADYLAHFRADAIVAEAQRAFPSWRDTELPRRAEGLRAVAAGLRGTR